MNVSSRLIWLCLFSIGLTGCNLSQPFPDPAPQTPISQTEIASIPALGQPALTSDDGEQVFELELAGETVWVYTPPQAIASHQKLPAILIAPAGSNLLSGMALAEGDLAEHLPYLEAGFVVIAYALSGADSTQEFAAANGGLDNGRNALALAKQLSFVDPAQIFTAGHSSAGETALLLASHEPSLAGLLMFNSSGEGCWHQSIEFLASQKDTPGFIEFCQQTRAASHIHHLEVPSFVFGSKADTITPPEEVERLVAAIKATGVDVNVKTVETGDHYKSMIQSGIPAGIQWIKSRTSRSAGGGRPRSRRKGR